MAFENHKVFPAERKGDVLIVAPQGDALGFRDSDLERELKALSDAMDDSDGLDLLVDLGAADYFGSVVIGAIASLGRKALEQKRQAALCNVSEQMDQVLRVMHVDSLWQHYSTRREALKALKS